MVGSRKLAGRKKKKQVQKVSRKEKWKVWKSICMCLHHQNRLNHSMFVFPTWKYGEAGTAKTPIYPIAQLDALKFAPTSNVLRPRQPQRETLNEQARASASDRGGERDAAGCCGAARAAHKCGLCATNEHDFSGRTECRLSKNHGHWAQDCPEARKADWNERNGEQERRGRVTDIQQATKKGSKNLLTHTHNTLTYTDSNKAICNEEMLANSLCVIVEVLNNAICNEDMLATFMCDCWSFE